MSGGADNRSRLRLVGLAAMFFVPLALAFLLYYGTGWRPAGGIQNGELIDPVRPLPAIALTQVDGGLTAPDVLRGRWTLVHLAGGDCDEGCREALEKTRQLRLALDKDIDRVRRVWLFTGTAPAAAFLAREHPDLLAARADDDAGKALLGTFPADSALRGEERLFIVDPLGNLMMLYPADAPPRAILTDLERLLRLSHIG